MLRKLKRKFILINMILVALVLVVAFSTIIVINRQQRLAEVTNTLEGATSSNRFDMDFSMFGGFDANPFSGTAPDGTVPSDVAGSAETTSSTGSSSTTGTTSSTSSSSTTGTTSSTGSSSTTGTTGTHNGSTSGSSSTQPGGNDAQQHMKSDDGRLVAVSSFEVDGNGAITATLIDTYGIDTTSRDQAISEALSAGTETGTLSDLNLYYLVRTDSSSTRVAFVPTSYVTSSTLTLAGTLAIIGGCALVAFFFISLFLARWALKPVERSWTQQQQFVADASHELKTPLTVIMANNSILMAHPKETIDSQMQWIESTESEAHLMQGLVGDLLFLAKPENQLPTQKIAETVDLSDLVESNVLQFESIAFEKRIDLDSDVEAGITVRGSKTRLQRLVGVLVDNACKYADEDGTVRVRLSRRNGHPVLSVTNSGTVIQDEDLPHIFDRFYRADKARVRSEGGFGLGLAIAKEIVDEHKGTITATSSADKGTTFSVTF